MPDVREQRIAEILRDLGCQPDPQEVDRRLDNLLHARYDCKHASIDDATYLRHLEQVRQRVIQPRGLSWPLWLQPRLRMGLAAFAILAAAMLVTLLGRHPARQPVDLAVKQGAGQSNPAPRHEHDTPVHEGGARPDQERTAQSHAGPRPHGLQSGPPIPQLVVGRIASAMGEPRIYDLGRKGYRVPRIGDPIRTGTRIETGDADKASVRFSDGSLVALSFKSSVTVPAAAQKEHRWARRLNLEAGNLEASVKHDASGVRFAVRTPVATAEDLGTEFTLRLKKVRLGKEDKLRLEAQVREGSLAVSNEFGRVVAGAQTETACEEGKAPEKPKRLIVLDVSWSNPKSFVVTTSSKRTIDNSSNLFEYPLGWTGFDWVTLPDGRERITSVADDTTAWPFATHAPGRAVGLRPGDVIVAKGGIPLSNEVHARRLARVGDTYSLTIERGGARRDINVVLAPWPGSQTTRANAHEIVTFDRAISLAMTGKPGQALASLLEASRRAPSAAVYNNIAVLYHCNDQLGEAIRYYQRAVRMDAGWWRYHHNLGLALEEIGNLDRALEEQRQAAAQNPAGAGMDLAWTWRLAHRHDRMLAYLRAHRAWLIWRSNYWASVATALYGIGDKAGALSAARKGVVEVPFAPDSYLMEGLVASKVGLPDEGETAYRKAIEIDPRDSTGHHNLALLLGTEGRYNEAVSEYEIAISDEPTNPVSYASLGLLLANLDRLAEAEALCRKAITLAPDYFDGYATLGVVLFDAGKLKEAEKECRAALRLDPNDLRSLGNLAIIMDGLGRADELEAECRHATLAEPKEWSTHFRLGLSLNHNGKANEAEEEFRVSIRLNPRRAESHNMLGAVLIDKGSLANAEAELREAIDIDPTFESAHHNLGDLLSARGRPAEAELETRKALALDPACSGAHNQLGVLLMNKGLKAEAESEYRRSIFLDRTSAPPHANLASLLASEGQSKEAESEYRLAIGLTPKEPRLYRELALLMLRLGRSSEAEEILRKAISTVVRAAPVRATLGWVLLQMGKLREAEVELRESISLEGNVDYEHNDLGVVLRAMGRLGEAAAEFRAANKLGGRSYANLADVLSAMGRSEESEETYREGLRSDPKNPTFRLGLNQQLTGSADAKLGRGDVAGAEHEYREAMRLAPDDSWNLALAAQFYIRQGRQAEALPLMERCEKCMAGSYGSYELSVCYELLGKLDDAERLLRRAVAEDADTVHSHNELAWFLFRFHRKPEEALELSLKANAIKPDDPNLVDTLGCTQMALDRLDDAEKTLRRALSLYGKSAAAADSWMHLAQVLERKNDRSGAIECCKKALQIAPNHAEAKQMLRRLVGA